MSHRGHRGWGRFPSSKITTVSRTFWCRKWTRIAVLVAARPGHPSTGQLRGPPLVGKAMQYFCGSSPVVKSLCYYVSMIHESRTEFVTTVDELASLLDIKSLCLFSDATFMPFRLLSLFSLRKMWDSRIMILCSLFKSFLFVGINFYLIWICLIFEWTAPLPFLLHFLTPAFSESLLFMTAVTSGSFCTAPCLKNTWEYGCRTSCSSICVAAYAYQFPVILGVYDFLCVLTLESLTPAMVWWGIFFLVFCWLDCDCYGVFE